MNKRKEKSTKEEEIQTHHRLSTSKRQYFPSQQKHGPITHTDVLQINHDLPEAKQMNIFYVFGKTRKRMPNQLQDPN